MVKTLSCPVVRANEKKLELFEKNRTPANLLMQTKV